MGKSKQRLPFGHLWIEITRDGPTVTWAILSWNQQKQKHERFYSGVGDQRMINEWAKTNAVMAEMLRDIGAGRATNGLAPKGDSRAPMKSSRFEGADG